MSAPVLDVRDLKKYLSSSYKALNRYYIQKRT